MAAEAILKVKEAEEKAREILAEAVRQVKLERARAQEEAASKTQEILRQAEEKRDEMLAEAAANASVSCEAIAEQGERDRKGILEPDPGKFNESVQLVVERIVGNGNR